MEDLGTFGGVLGWTLVAACGGALTVLAALIAGGAMLGLFTGSAIVRLLTRPTS